MTENFTQDDWIRILEGDDLIKSSLGRTHTMKGHANSDRVTHFARNELPELKDHLYDALSHHLSGYYHHLKKNDTKNADRHMRYFHQYMDLAERLANENPTHMKVDVPADPQHWEQNAKVKEDGSPTNSALHGWRLNQADYSHIRKPPHAKFTQRIQAHGHNGAYPLERIKINGKFLDVDPEFDGEPSSKRAHSNEAASINHHGMDHHPMMKHYTVNRKPTPYFSLSHSDKEKINSGTEKDRWGKAISQPDPDLDYDEVEEKFNNKYLPSMEDFKNQMEDYHKEAGTERGKQPHSPVHGRLAVKHLNLAGIHGHLGQKEVNTGKKEDPLILNKDKKEVHLSTSFLHALHTSNAVEDHANSLFNLHGGIDNLKFFHKDTGEEIAGKDLKDWYKKYTEKTEVPKEEEVKTEAPKTEAPKTEAPKAEAPKSSMDNIPKPDTSKMSTGVKSPQPKTEEPKKEDYSHSSNQQVMKVNKPKPAPAAEPKKESFFSKLKTKLSFKFNSPKDGSND